MQSVVSKNLDGVINNLKKILETSNNPVLLWSGGKDSTLLLFCLEKIKAKIPIICFHYFWTPAQKRYIMEIIKEHKISPIFYNPIKIQFSQTSLVPFLNIGGEDTPIIFDIVHDNQVCGLDLCEKLQERGKIQPSYIWDSSIVGSKKVDNHRLVNSLDFGTRSKTHTWQTPLWEFTDQEVLDMCSILGLRLSEFYNSGEEKLDTGNFVGCLNCMTKRDNFCPKTNGKLW